SVCFTARLLGRPPFERQSCIIDETSELTLTSCLLSRSFSCFFCSGSRHTLIVSFLAIQYLSCFTYSLFGGGNPMSRCALGLRKTQKHDTLSLVYPQVAELLRVELCVLQLYAVVFQKQHGHP